ncbi:MAG: hypothetical protein CM1200mP39_21110 [Dehalococcoidia bacterium]|nr:MAG: hypothetical protein CM1200mP39_21110 [Dehalococcoidia bacterium]
MAEVARLEAVSSAERVESEIASARQGKGEKIISDAREAASKLREQEQSRARAEGRNHA